MATFEQQLTKLQAKQAKEREDLEREHDILNAIPPDLVLHEWHIHVYRLYDREASISLRPNRYESLRKGPDPTLQTVRQLWETFPGVDLAVYRNRSVGIRTLPDARREWDAAQAHVTQGHDTSATVMPIAPFYLRVDSADREINFCWVAHVAGRLVECRVTQGYAVLSKVGALSVRYTTENPRYENNRTVIANTFSVADRLTVIRDSRVGSIRYSSSSPQRPGDHLLYWDSCDGESGSATIPDVLDRLV